MAQKIQRKPQIDQTMKKIFKSNFQPKYGYFGKTMCTVVAIQGDFRPKKFFWPKKKFFFGPKKKKIFFLGPTVGPQSPTVGLQSPSVGLQSPTDGPLSPSVGLRGSDCRTQGVSPLFTHSKHDRPHRAANFLFSVSPHDSEGCCAREAFFPFKFLVSRPMNCSCGSSNLQSYQSVLSADVQRGVCTANFSS